MKAEVTYLGRAVSLHPANLGLLFEEHCTVNVIEQVPASEENGWKRGQEIIPRKMFWYDKQGSKEYFCAFSGYLDRIIEILNERGIEIDFRDICDAGLGDPDLSKVAGTVWRPKQPEVLSAILAYRNGVIDMPTGCHAKGQPILMHDGRVLPVELVRSGDLVMGPDSTPRTVRELIRGVGPMYRVTPVKGDPFVISEQHVLTLVGNDPRDKTYGHLTDVVLSDYLRWSAHRKHTHKLIRTGVEFLERKLPIDPRFLGIYLGDGSTAGGTVKITKPDRELFEYCLSIGLNVREVPSAKVLTYSVIGDSGKAVREVLLSLGLSKVGSCDRFIPECYLVASSMQRLQLLAGLVDTDGYVCKGCVEYVSGSELLANDVCRLSRSLGFAAYVKKTQKGCQTGVAGTYWRVSILGDTNRIPVLIPRKMSEIRRQVKSVLREGFTVEACGKGEYYGFELDGDRRYVMGDYTITHNSGKTFLIKKLAQIYPAAKIIVTVSSTDIAKDIYKALRLDIPDLGMIGAGQRKRGRVVVALAQSLHHCDVNANIVLADEAHTLCTDNYVDKLTNFLKAKFFGFTASPEGRSDRADGMLEALFGPVRVKVGYQEAVSHGSIVDIKVRMIPIRSGPDVSGSKDKVWVDKVGIWTNHFRNESIATAARQMVTELGPEEQILIMVDKIEHAYRLGQLLPDYTIVTGELPADKVDLFQKRGIIQPGQQLCSPEQREEYKQQFMAGTLKLAIATKIWSKGVDFKDLAVLIRADGLATDIDSHQVPGRLSRLGHKQAKSHGILLDCYDLFSRNLKARSESRMRVYKSNGWEIGTQL